jgi:hypothetical protein
MLQVAVKVYREEEKPSTKKRASGLIQTTNASRVMQAWLANIDSFVSFRFQQERGSG